MKTSTTISFGIVPLALSLLNSSGAIAFPSGHLYSQISSDHRNHSEKQVLISQRLSQHQPYEQECFALYAQAQFVGQSHRYYIHPNKEIEQLTYIPASYGRESCSRRVVGTLNSPGVYTIWRIEGNSLVFAQLSGDDKDIMGTRRGSSASSSQSSSQPSRRTASSKPQRSLIGNAWEIDLGSGRSGLRYLFCNSMRYETQGRSFFGQSGRYSTDGSYLTTRRDDGKVESFSLRWGSGSVDLINRSSGKVSMTLYYYTTAKC